MINGATAKLLAVIVAIVGLLAWGWFVRGWYEADKQLAVERTIQKTIDAAMVRESGIAKVVEDKLATLKASERVIDRGVIREITKPIYRNICITDAGWMLINSAAKGTAGSLPAEFASEVPGNIAVTE